MRKRLVEAFIIVLVASTFLWGATQTINTIPVSGSTFLSTLQAFLRGEDPARFQKKYAGFVLQGGIGTTSASLAHTITALTAFPGGYYVYKAATAHTYSATTRTYVYADYDSARSLTIAGASVTRSTYLVFAEMAAGSDEPATPAYTVRLMKVDTDGTSITDVDDYRNGGTIDVEVYGSLSGAATNAPPCTLTLARKEIMTGNVTLPSTVSFEPLNGALVVTDGNVLTIGKMSPRVGPYTWLETSDSEVVFDEASGRIYIDWFGTTSTAIQSAFTAIDGADDYVWVFTPGRTYTITSTVDCNLGDRCRVEAEGALFTGTLDDTWFNLYEDASIIREAHWHGGYFVNSGDNDSAVCLQVSDVREGSISGAWIVGFYSPIQFHHVETFTIERNFLKDFEGYGIRFKTSAPDDADGTWNSRNLMISRNGITVADAAAEAVSGISLEHRNENARILYNTIDCNFSGPAIYVVDATAGSTHGAKPYGVLEICGNHMEGIATAARTPRVGIHVDDPAELGYGGVRITGNHFGSSTSPYTVTFINLDRVTSGYVGENYFYASGTDVDVTSTAIDLDANCTSMKIGDTNQYNTVDTKVTAACARSEFTLEPEIRQIECDLVGYNADTIADGTYTIDMSTAMASDWPDDAIPKGYWIVMTAEDSSSATGGDTDCYLKMKKDAAAGAISSVQLYLGGGTNDLRRSVGGYVEADANGDIYLTAQAKGTMTVWISVQALDM